MKHDLGRDWLVLIAGSRWEGTRGTDHRLAVALAKTHQVLWVDPPVPLIGPAAQGRPGIYPGFKVDPIGEGLVRLRVLVPPKFTKPLVRPVASLLLHRAIRRIVDTQPTRPLATVLMSPRETFPHGMPGRKVLHVTDDWAAGAELMGLQREKIEGTLRANLKRADIVTVVSPHLVGILPRLGTSADPVVLPNGCHVPAGVEPVDETVERTTVGLIGQLNERLDMDLLERLVDTGLPIDVIGPRRERNPETTRRLDHFLAAPNVTWTDEIPESDLWGRSLAMAVGITPYADTEFNRASFPLKTLDYLAAGLPVVSTNLPAVRWIGSPLINVGHSAQEFVDLVKRAQSAPLRASERGERQALARRHSWDARAAEMLRLLTASTVKP